MHAADAYELVDFGDGRRLEQFGGRLVARPHPPAVWPRRHAARWSDADLVYDRDRGWSGGAGVQGPWTMTAGGVTLELRPTEAGQVGCFPEHQAMLPWLLDEARRRATDGGPGGASGHGHLPPAVLNLFAYTGLATLALAAAGVAVTHVDSSRPTVAWARRNASLSGVDDRPIRWIVDDATAYCRREERRSRRYHGIVLDPPSYGHGPGGRPWRLEEGLGDLLAMTAGLLEPDGFVQVTAHTPGFDGDRLADALTRAFGRPSGPVERGYLEIVASDGRRLELGAFARRTGRT